MESLYTGRTGLGPEGSGPKSRRHCSWDNGMDVSYTKLKRIRAIHLGELPHRNFLNLNILIKIFGVKFEF